MPNRWSLTLLVAGMACVPFYPPSGAIRIDPPPRFERLYAEMETCLGRQGDFAAVRWWMVPGYAFRREDWLYEALHRFGFANQPTSTHKGDGLRVTDCYIAAVVRCAPPGNKPLPREFDACRPYLMEEFRLLTRVKVVLALGKIAFDHYLKACQKLGHELPKPALRFGHGVVYRLPWGVTLIGSYHPSQQNTFTGKLTRPMFHSVFRKARKAIGRT